MADYTTDKRVVLTLDAGGTNMVFGAIRGGEYIVDPITKPANSHDLDLCLTTMVEGFREVIAMIDEDPVAISFAFPGPADYPNGIIGGYLPNFPSFRDGVALGPFLQEKFGLPVFINNDGDLFAYGEALGGVLPEVNAKLEALGSSKRYKNMVGCFSQPDFVVCDVALLKTLSDREFRTGLAEIIKAAIIADEELFCMLESCDFSRLKREPKLLCVIVLRAIKVKADIIECDERESGERRKLNLGHTLAHAIEKCSSK